MATIEAIVFDPKAKKLNLAKVEMPSPPGKNEVIVKVAYAGICGTDLHIIDVSKAPGAPTPPPVQATARPTSPFLTACLFSRASSPARRPLSSWGTSSAASPPTSVPASLTSRAVTASSSTPTSECRPRRPTVPP